LYLFPFEGSCILTVDYRSPRSICLSTLRIWGIPERTKFQCEANSHGCLPTRPICGAMVKSYILLHLFLSGRFLSTVVMKCMGLVRS
jgi:hypothetical protein